MEGKGGADLQVLVLTDLQPCRLPAAAFTGLSRQETEVGAGRPEHGFDLHVHAQLVWGLLGGPGANSAKEPLPSAHLGCFLASL